mgnify:CR=1 FL=1
MGRLEELSDNLLVAYTVWVVVGSTSAIGTQTGAPSEQMASVLEKLAAGTQDENSHAENLAFLIEHMGHAMKAQDAKTRRLREEHSVYMLGSSRINVAGINASNLDYVADAVAKVIA